MTFTKKKLFGMAFVLAVLACIFTMPASAMGTDVQQTNNDVNLRTGPGTSYNIITVVPVGTTVYIEQNLGDWCYVDYNAPSGTVTGYLCSRYLGSYTPSSTGSTGGSSLKDCRITTNVNLRSGPGTGYSIYTVLPAGSSVSVDSVTNGWAHTYYGNYEGYVASQYVSGLSGSSYSTGNANKSSTVSGNSTWYGGYNYANVFNPVYYAVHNQDVVQAVGNSSDALLQHFINHGMSEGRQGCESFNVYSYMDQHPDLVSMFSNNFKAYYLYACGIPF